ADGRALVIDYKTEARATTQARVRHPEEDTQLAFYGALLDDDSLQAMYLNIAESDSTKAFDMPDIDAWRDQLVAAIVDDMARIAAGAELPAIGAGSACEHCAARGLCRKDFWSADAGAAHG
ncbi:MAG: PD-(D/E)XK nuclease family protein, partial [Rhodoferax sp.]|nr:PD-(D/E)XK nuclease family protein [Rhodoferax sp.]